MKVKQKVDMGIAFILVLIGTALLVLPIFQISKVKWLSIIVFSLYSILGLIRYILTRKSKDYEGLHNFLASFIMLIATIIFNPESSPRTLAMLLMAWIILMSLAKLKKMDYYNDRRDRMWKICTFNLAFFILSGILASINLAYSGIVQTIVIGFFLLIHGILELFEPIAKTLISHS